jgi:uncharacterized protein YoaH (UPF0181 family)
MPANLVIDADRTWRPPGWVYNHVVSHLAQRFMAHDRELSDFFERCLGPENPTFDWRSLSPQRQEAASAEIRHLMKKVMHSGESVMAEPIFLEQLRAELSELTRMVGATSAI